MNDYEKGRHVKWDVDKAITDYAELCQMLGMPNMKEKQPEVRTSSGDGIEILMMGRFRSLWKLIFQVCFRSLFPFKLMYHILCEHV